MPAQKPVHLLVRRSVHLSELGVAGDLVLIESGSHAIIHLAVQGKKGSEPVEEHCTEDTVGASVSVFPGWPDAGFGTTRWGGHDRDRPAASPWIASNLVERSGAVA
jgi:hypothetical protein